MGLDLLLLFQHLLASDLEGHSKTELGRLLKFTYVVSFCQIREISRDEVLTLA